MTTETRSDSNAQRGGQDTTATAAWIAFQRTYTQQLTRQEKNPQRPIEAIFNCNDHIHLPFGIHTQVTKLFDKPEVLDRALFAATIVKTREWMDMGMDEESLNLVITNLKKNTEVMKQRLRSADKGEKRRAKRELILFFQYASDAYKRQERKEDANKTKAKVVFPAPEDT